MRKRMRQMAAAAKTALAAVLMVAMLASSLPLDAVAEVLDEEAQIEALMQIFEDANSDDADDAEAVAEAEDEADAGSAEAAEEAEEDAGDSDVAAAADEAETEAGADGSSASTDAAADAGASDDGSSTEAGAAAEEDAAASEGASADTDAAADSAADGDSASADAADADEDSVADTEAAEEDGDATDAEDVVDASNMADPDAVTLVEAPELSASEFEQIAAVSAAESVAAAEEAADEEDTDADDEEDTDPYTLDGTTIMDIEVSWITADDEEDGSAARLTLVKNSNGTFSVKIQVSFELSGQYNYSAGDISITIPKSIFTNRDGTSAGTVTLSVPEAPDSSATFNYTEYDDCYVLTNVKTLTAASHVMFEISVDGLTPSDLVGNGEYEDVSTAEAEDGTTIYYYDEDGDGAYDEDTDTLLGTSDDLLFIDVDGDGAYTAGTDILVYLSDAFFATIQVTTNKGNTITRTSNSIDASINTTETIGNADIKSNGLSTTWPSGWDSALAAALGEDADTDDYIYVEWYSWVSVTGNQEYSMEVTSDASVCDLEGAVILGMYSSYTGLVVNEGDEDGNLTDTMTLTLTEDDYLSSGKTGYYVYTYVAIPKSSFTEADTTYEIEHQVTYTLTSLDDNRVTSSTDTAKVEYEYLDSETGVSGSGVSGFVDVSKYGGYSYSSALDSLREEDGSATARYKVTSTGSGGLVVATDEDGVESVSAVPFVLQTEDGELYFNYGSTALDGTDSDPDYEFASVELVKPAVYVWQQYTESGYGYYYTYDEDGTATALTYGLINGGSWGYAATSDASLLPEVRVYGSSDGGQTWTLYAVGDWTSGSALYTVYNGATVSGNTVSLPSGVTAVRTEASNVDATGTAQAEVIVSSFYPVVRLLASDEVAAQVEELFASSDAPTTILRNYVDVALYGAEVAEDGGYTVDEENLLGTDTAYATDTLMGSALSVAIEKTMTYVNDTSASEVDLSYTITVYEHSNLTTQEEYEAALAAGAFEEETSGVFYDLLPLGVTVDTSTIQMTSEDDVVTNVELIYDYEGSGRTMMVVTVALTPSAAYASKSVSGTPYNGYCDSFTLTFDATYSWTALTDYGADLNNVVAFESGNESLGTIEGFCGTTASTSAEDGVYSSLNNAAKSAIAGVVEYMTSDLAELAGTEDALYVYANCQTSIDVVTTAATSITKTVAANGSSEYTSGLEVDGSAVNVYENGSYTYRIQVLNDNTSQTKDIVIFDVLEAFVPSEAEGEDADDYGDWQWQGTLTGIDTSLLEALGVDVQVYYSTLDASVLEAGLYTVEESGTTIGSYASLSAVDANGEAVWQLLTDSTDLSCVTALAVDCTHLVTDSDGDGEADEFVLGAGEALSFTISMQAPSAAELAAAYNEYYGYTEGDEGYATADDFFDVDLDDEAGETESGLSGGAHAYNNVVLVAQSAETGTTSETSWTSDQLSYYNYTKVGLLPFEISVTKTFDDEDDQDGIRPTAAYLVLLANGEAVELDTSDAYVVEITVGEGADAVTYTAVRLSGVNGWAYTFDEVTYLDEDGVAISYSFAEYLLVEAEDGTSSYVAAESCGYTLGLTWSQTEAGYEYALVNVHVPETVDISGTKTWDDANDAAGARPESVEVALYADGELVRTLTVSANSSGEWSYTFYDLPRYAVETVTDEATGEEVATGGHEISYEVAETVYYAGYYATVDGYDVENTYDPYGNLQISKALEDATEASADTVFSFRVTIYEEAEDGADPSPSAASYTYEILDAATGEVAFDEDGAKLAGTLRTGDTLQITASQVIVIYDIPSEYTYTVEEVDVPDGFTLSESAGEEGAIYAGQTSEAAFTNTYSATGKVSLTATKELTGRTLEAKQFRFELTDEDGTTLRTATNDADGTVTFGSLSYTLDDVGQTYTYYIAETDAGASGYTYDSTVYKACVTVTDNGDGTLGASVTYLRYDADSEQWVALTATDEDGSAVATTPTFANGYEASGSLSLVAWKTLSGRDLVEGEFAFQLVDSETGEVVAYGVNDENGIITFGEIAFDQADAGQTFTFVASEIVPAAEDEDAEADEDADASDEDADASEEDAGEAEAEDAALTVPDVTYDEDVVYSTQTFTYTVTVVDNGDGTLSFTSTTDDQPVFENELDTGSLSISKSVTSDSADDGTDTEFSFVLTLTGAEGGTLVESYRDADGVYHYTYVAASEDDADEEGSGEESGESDSAEAETAGSEDTSEEGTESDETEEEVESSEEVSASSQLSVSYASSDEAAASSLEEEVASVSDDDAETDDSATDETETDDDADAVTVTASGTTGDITWTLTSDGVLTFSGSGTLANYSDSSMPPWSDYASSITAVATEEGSSIAAGSSLKNLFYGCSSLADISGLASWDTSNVTDLGSVFRGCSSLTSLDAIEGWSVTSKLTNLQNAFYGCSSLSDISALSSWDVSNITSLYYTFRGCSSLTSLDALASWNISSKVLSLNCTFYGCSALTSLAGLANWDVSGATTLASTFYGCSSLTSLTGLEKWASSSATTLASTFYGCSKLTDLSALADWNVAKVTTLASTFRGCSSLMSLEGLTKWDVSSVTSLSATFYGCSSLTSLEGLESWSTANVTTLYTAFTSCSGLASLSALSSWNVAKVTSLEMAFYRCSSLTSLAGLSSWKVGAVTSFRATFEECTTLADVSALASWDTSAATSMSRTFMSCTALVTVSLPGWTSPKLTNISQMFYSCTALATLDISGLNTGSCTTMANLFYNTSALERVTLGASWSWNGATTVATGTLKDAPSTTVTSSDGTSTTYTGNWIREDGSYGSYTAAALAAAWDQSYAGTWVWETGGTYYTVVFDANVGADEAVSGSMASRLYSVNSGLTLPTNAYYRFGYTFAGWNTAADGGGTSYSDGATIATALISSAQLNDATSPVTSITLYAQWTKSSSAVAAGADGTYTLTLSAGESLVIEGLPAGTGYLVYEESQAGWVLVASSGTSGAIEPNTTAAAAFTNEYDEAATAAQIVATKTLDGEAVSAAGAFSFTLTAVSATDSGGNALLDSDGTQLAVPMPTVSTTSTDEDGTITTTTSTATSPYTVANTAGGGVSFGSITYTQAGVYTYTIAEVTSGTGTSNTITYDTTSYTVVVTVSAAEDGLTSSVAYYENTTVTDDGGVESTVAGSAVSAATFANTTNPGTIQITKTVTGATSTDATFTFRVQYDGGLTTELVTLPVEVTAEDGTTSLSYTWTSGELAAGTTYTITEVSVPDGYTFGGFTVSVDGGDAVAVEGSTASGTVAAGSTYAYTATNTYAATGTVSFEATKTLWGRTLASEEFTFELVESLDEDATVLATASNLADGTVLFADAVTLSAAGTYTYYLREVAGDDATVSYATNAIKAEVTATDNGDGTLATSVTYWYADSTAEGGWTQYTVVDEDGTAAGATGSFANELKTGSLAVSKTVEGATSATASATFAFTVSFYASTGEELDDAFPYTLTSADGTVTETDGGGDALTIVSGGTLTLAAGQTALITGLPAGATYSVAEGDVSSGYTLTEASGTTGSIVAGATAAAAFTNTYAATGSWAPTATKTLTGGIDLEEGAFKFYLKSASGTILLTGTNEGAATSDSSSSAGTASAGIVFDGELSYTEADAGQTYTYYLTELVQSRENITYDETEYKVEVAVADNGDGTLTTTATWYVKTGTETTTETVTAEDGTTSQVTTRTSAYEPLTNVLGIAITPTFTNAYRSDVSLPETGAAGIDLPTAVGLLILTVSAAVLLHQSRHRRRRSSR